MREPVLDRSRYQNFKAEGAPDDFHHVAWKTMKYDEMIDFYTSLFDCKPLYTSEDLTFLKKLNPRWYKVVCNQISLYKNLSSRRISLFSMLRDENHPELLPL